jgi:hypothetical protein
VSGRDGSATVSSTNRCCRATAPRIAARGDPEDDQSLVTAELEHAPSVILDHRAGHLSEAPGEARGILVPPFLCEGRVPADVGDQERVDVRVSAGVRLGSRAARWPAPPTTARHPAESPGEYGLSGARRGSDVGFARNDIVRESLHEPRRERRHPRNGHAGAGAPPRARPPRDRAHRGAPGSSGRRNVTLGERATSGRLSGADQLSQHPFFGRLVRPSRSPDTATSGQRHPPTHTRPASSNVRPDAPGGRPLSSASARHSIRARAAGTRGYEFR